MSDTKHAPKLVLDEKGCIYCEQHRKPAPFTGSDGVYHADYFDGLIALPYGCEELTANEVAELIVQAVNNYAAMVAALETLEQLASYYAMPNTALLNAALDKARAALALAKKGE